MPSTIGWFALAIGIGALVGLAVGHLSAVAAWIGRCLRDPTLPPRPADDPTALVRKRSRRTS